MDPIFEGFKKAYEEGNGYDLSMTLSPVDLDDEPDRLYNFFRSTNFSQVKKDFQYRILYDSATPFKLPAEEGNGWVEVYLAYWKAVGDILNAENAQKSNAKVSIVTWQVAICLCQCAIPKLRWQASRPCLVT